MLYFKLNWALFPSLLEILNFSAPPVEVNCCFKSNFSLYYLMRLRRLERSEGSKCAPVLGQIYF